MTGFGLNRRKRGYTKSLGLLRLICRYCWQFTSYLRQGEESESKTRMVVREESWAMSVIWATRMSCRTCRSEERGFSFLLRVPASCSSDFFAGGDSVLRNGVRGRCSSGLGVAVFGRCGCWRSELRNRNAMRDAEIGRVLARCTRVAQVGLCDDGQRIVSGWVRL
jgi:hypothetical protein